MKGTVPAAEETFLLSKFKAVILPYAENFSTKSVSLTLNGSLCRYKHSPCGGGGCDGASTGVVAISVPNGESAAAVGLDKLATNSTFVVVVVVK